MRLHRLPRPSRPLILTAATAATSLSVRGACRRAMVVADRLSRETSVVAVRALPSPAVQVDRRPAAIDTYAWVHGAPLAEAVYQGVRVLFPAPAALRRMP